MEKLEIPDDLRAKIMSVDEDSFVALIEEAFERGVSAGYKLRKKVEYVSKYGGDYVEVHLNTDLDHGEAATIIREEMNAELQPKPSLNTEFLTSISWKDFK